MGKRKGHKETGKQKEDIERKTGRQSEHFQQGRSD